MKLKIINYLLLLLFLGCTNKIPFEKAEQEILATKEKKNALAVFEQLGVTQAALDSISKNSNITQRGQFFYTIYRYMNTVTIDTLKIDDKARYKLLKLRIHKKPYPKDFEDVLELITIRDMKKQTVMTKAYVSPYCGRAEPKVTMQEIRNGIYGINILSAVSCGYQIATEKYCDTLIVQRDTLLYKRDESGGSSDAFNIFDELEKFNK